MSSPDAKSGRGLLFGLGAYGTWGMFPAFFPLLKPAGAFEVLAHRIVWTLLFMAVVVLVAGKLGEVRRLSGRTWALLAVASLFISCNWVTYIWAVNNGHVVDAALGYFINPLVSVALGVVIFRERLTRGQIVALLIAVVAVVILTLEVGALPYISIGLALSFGLYGLVKKVVSADPRVSVGVESGLAAPFALAFIVVTGLGGQGEFLGNGAGHIALTMLCGPVTALPLLLFAAAAQRLPLVTLGLLQYLTPAMQMTYGVLVGQEPMPPGRWLGFALIWVALGIFSVDAIRRARLGRISTD